MKKFGILLLSLTLLSGCSMRKMLADSMVATLQDTSAQFFAEKSTRMGREAAPGLLKTLDGIIAGSPYNYDLLLLGAQLNGGFALAFIEDEDKQWARILYDRGFEYSLRAFDSEELNKAVRKNPEVLKKVLADYGTGWVPWMFWAGNCMASSINLRRDETGAIADLAIAKTFIDRVIELKRGDYYYGGSHVIVGIFYGSRSKLGGNSEIARKHFEKALKLSKGKFLLFSVLYAQYYAVYADCLKCHNGKDRAVLCQTCGGKGVVDGKECKACKGYGRTYCTSCEGTGQELKTFRTLLKKVVDAPDDLLPKEYLANQVAKQKAKKMLKNISNYFNFPTKPSQDPFQKKVSKEDEKKKKGDDEQLFNEMEKD